MSLYFEENSLLLSQHDSSSAQQTRSRYDLFTPASYLDSSSFAATQSDVRSQSLSLFTRDRIGEPGNQVQTCPLPSCYLSRPYYLPMRTIKTTENATCHLERSRTGMYFEVLLAYIKSAQARGFKTAHIWASPPTKGDDYALHCHPPFQKTPLEEKLLEW